MKKSLLLSAFFCCFLVTQVAFAQEQTPAPMEKVAAPVQQTSARPASTNSNDPACCDTPCGDCWCLYVHYEPCYYTTKRCVEERIPCTKQCCRKVPKYYQVERCRMVPEKYTETVCKYENEYYCEPDCKVCKKTVCDQHCTYKPKYYWKRTCNNVACPQ